MVIHLLDGLIKDPYVYAVGPAKTIMVSKRIPEPDKRLITVYWLHDDVIIKLVIDKEQMEQEVVKYG